MKNEPISLSLRQDVYRKIDLFIGANPQEKWYLSLTKKESKRGLSANNQQHRWYGEIDIKCNHVKGHAKRFCKYTFGLPILLNSDIHRDYYETLFDRLGFWNDSYENKIYLMEAIEVTSKFNTAESKIYMDQMIYYFNDNGIPIKFKGK